MLADGHMDNLNTTHPSSALIAEGGHSNEERECRYEGTDRIEEKIIIIGICATFVAVLSIVLNTFYTIVFLRNQSLRRSGMFYFGVLAVIDAIMAVNYIALMSVSVYIDYFKSVFMYTIYLKYIRILMTESNCAICASLLMILLATTERVFRTFEGKQMEKCRRFLEKNRRAVSAFCVLFACCYKLCTFWEIAVVETGCEKPFEAISLEKGYLSQNEYYQLIWQFWFRNIFERFLPFFYLIITNILLVRAAKQESAKTIGNDPKARNPKVARRSVRDATRALISLVSMYLLSQTLQVILTTWETFFNHTLDDHIDTYSYMNDFVSIACLLSSCLRFPVYFVCNRQIHMAAVNTVKDLKKMCCRRRGSSPTQAFLELVFLSSKLCFGNS
ncbi:hypothetical protein WR25_20652 isoform B [Diploscapter pachys]|uniref:G-protein coupled receptors family 1 profile domain-containing protein n=2 Tax=Diploscapter pachys TaxID=2018661 RepID=A0A2A2L2G6_9BILA|nr:hypothetical protein WR25_20652 isoform B [Diploscapter pachys]